MNSAPPLHPTPSESFDREGARKGVRAVKGALLVGLLGQLLIWGSAVALWIVGSLFANVPTHTTIAYGANGISISAGEIFAINLLLIGGTVIAVGALILADRGFRALGRASSRSRFAGVSGLTTTGSIGFGLFAVAWLVWLGSFVAPGVNPPATPGFYTPVLASNLSATVAIMLVLGGFLAFIGMLGIAVGSSTLANAFEEPTVELGGVLSVLPALSIVGNILFILGLGHIDRKLGEGWVPPPPLPPSVPIYPVAANPAGYPSVGYYVPQSPPPSWDSLAVVLIVILFLFWILIIPFAFVATNGGITHGPATGGNGTPPSPSAGGAATPTGSTTIVALLVVGVIATGLLLPIAVVRNRRKRERAARLPPLPPPPPPPPPPTAEADPLDHLV